jgi:hypothetical protein
LSGLGQKVVRFRASRDGSRLDATWSIANLMRGDRLEHHIYELFSFLWRVKTSGSLKQEGQDPSKQKGQDSGFRVLTPYFRVSPTWISD